LRVPIPSLTVFKYLSWEPFGDSVDFWLGRIVKNIRK